MKKTLYAALALPLAFALFFSCKSTEGAAQKTDQVSSLQAQESQAVEEAPNAETEKIEDGQEIDQGTPQAQEEKIPESEMDELLSLLNDDNEEKLEEEIENEKSEEKEDENISRGITQSENGSLLEKIKGPDEESKNTLTTTKEDSSNSGGQDASVSVSPQSKESGDELSRVTNQGNKIQKGPLIGPGSNKNAGAKEESSSKNNNGRDNISESYDFSSSEKTQSASSSGQETNEAISLTPTQDEQEQESKEEKPEPVPSRSMTIKNNQFLDVIYPGSGWIYLGEEGAGDHFIFQGRKLGNGETTFTLRSKEPGVALLHFYKNDILTGNYIDDYIQISITDKSATDAVHVEAPSYAEVVPPKFDRTKAVEEKKVAQAPKESASQNEETIEQNNNTEPQAKDESEEEKEIESSPSEKVQTVIQTAGQDKDKTDSRQKTAVAGTNSPSAQDENKESALEEGFSGGTDKAKSLLERAQKAYDEKKYAEALDLVQQFFDTATEDFDAGLYLEGLILEAKSEVRNIKSAIGAYDTLIKNWPQSNYWRKANERSIYLKRFYIDIR